MKHDAWMDDLFWVRNSILSQAHMSSVLCDLCNDCLRVAGVSLYTPVDCQGIRFLASEKASLN